MRLIGLTILGLVGSLVLGASVGLATNPSTASGSYGGCQYGGYSEEFGDNNNYDDFSQTNQPPYAYCPDLMQVYAYFWGSDSQWHWLTSDWISGQYYAAVNTPYWGYWTNHVYGYHQIQQPTGSYSPKCESPELMSGAGARSPE